ncbi:MAG: hypothetical protein H7Y38_14700 [Armatimonadetes bacterium]|nr:hypothetical protein [Armatimonadota bacterium]
MAKQNNNGLIFAALVGGGLYWASKQPGGIKGTFDKYGKKLAQIQNSNDPIGEIKRQFNETKYATANSDRPYGVSAFDPANQI